MIISDTRKVLPLLEHLERLRKPVTYFALDLSAEALQNTMQSLSHRFRHVQCFGLWGSFSDGLTWLKSQDRPKFILSLGSMFGNDEFRLATKRLSEWTEVMGPQDYMLLGLDACKDDADIMESYNDPGHIWEEFIRNGLEYSNKVLGHRWYNEEDWIVSGRIEKTPDVVYRFSITARRDVECPPLRLKFSAKERVEFFEAWKYGPERMKNQFKVACFKEVTKWQAPGGRPFCELAYKSACQIPLFNTGV